MSSGASANSSSNNNGRNIVRGRDIRLKHSSDSNIDSVDNQELNRFLDDYEIDDDIYFLLLEFRKRKAFENKLKELQKKKDKMDGILRDVQAQHQRDSRFKTSRHSINSHRHQTRYEADGSEEDEIRLRSAHWKGNTYTTFQDRRNVFTTKWKELEQAELKLKQVENLMQMFQEQESEENLMLKDYIDQYISNNETNNIDNNSSGEDHRSDRSYFYQKQTLKDSKNNETKRSSSRNLTSRTLAEGNTHLNTNQHSLASHCPHIGSNSAESTTNGSSLENDSCDEISQQLRERFLESMQINFDSMKYVLENECFNLNQQMSNQQFFYLMLTQNYQILQQQQMLLYWLQKSSPCLNLCCTSEASRLNDNVANSMPNWNTSSMPPSSFTVQPRNQRKKVIHSLSRLQDVQDTITLNNKVAPGERANNYWDNFKSNSRQNQLSLTTNCSRTANVSKSNENIICSNQANGINHNYSPTLPIAVESGLQDLTPSSVNQTNTSKSSFSLAQTKKPSYANLHSIDLNQEKVKNTTLLDPARCSAQGSNEINSINSKVGKYSGNDKRQMNAANVGAVSGACGSSNSSMVMSLDRGNGSGTIIGSDLVLNRGSNATNGLPSQMTMSKIKPSNISIEDHSVSCQDLPNGIDNSLDLVASSIHHNNTRHHQIPLHIPPSTGAIRKKLRNPDVTESASLKQEKREESNGLANSETIRPLMAAEGRSYEALSLTNNPQTLSSLSLVKVPSQPLLIFRKRPPTTGATSRDENDPQIISSSVNSTDDDLREPDQTTIETVAELESVNAVNGGLGLIASNHISENVNIADSTSSEIDCNQSFEDDVEDEAEEDEEVEDEGEGEQEEEKEEKVIVQAANKSGVRVSGDGEQ